MSNEPNRPLLADLSLVQRAFNTARSRARDLGTVLQVAAALGPWRRQENGVITNPRGFTPLQAVAHEEGVRLGLRRPDSTLPPDPCWLLPRRDIEALERAATVRPAIGEVDREDPVVVTLRLILLAWCGWRTLPERWSISYDRWLGPPNATTRMALEGVGLVVLLGGLFLLFAVFGA